MRNKTTLALVASAVAVVAVVSGCGTSNSANSSTSSTSNSGSTAQSATGAASVNVKAATNKGTLVIYAAMGYDKAMGEAFQKATGIKVEVDDGSTGPMITKAEAETSNPHWDVIWFDGPSSMQAMDNQGMLLSNWTPNDVNNYTKLGKSLIPKDHSYYPGGLTSVGALGYDPKVTPKSSLPKTLDDLLKPQYKNALGMNDPAISGPAYPFVAGVMEQEGSVAKGKQYFEKLKANGLHVYDTNTVTINALLTGKIKFAMVQDSALFSDIAKGDPIAIDYLQSGTYTLPDVIGIDKNAPDMANAKKFVEFVLSKQGQDIMHNPKNGGSDSYYNPLIKGIMPAPLAAKYRQVVKWVPVNPITAAEEKNSLETWFHDNITY